MTRKVFPQIKSRPLLVPGSLLGLLILLFATSGLSGFYPVQVSDFGSVLVGRHAADPLAAYVILVLRLPRLLSAAFVGAAVALAGSMTQSLLQNPLAEPSVLGISAGASFVALFSLIVLHAPTDLLPLLAFLGAVCTGTAVMVLARGKAPGTTFLRLVLSGILVSIVFSAGILAVANYGEVFASNEVLRWMAGSLADVGWHRALPIVIVLPLLLPVVLFSGRTLRLHSLGEEGAQSLGARTGVERGWLLLTSAALVGASVAVAGPVAFVGLLVPNAVRIWYGRMDAVALITSALLGACLVSAADLIGRTLFAPIELPYGLITAILGAPYLVFVLLRVRKVA